MPLNGFWWYANGVWIDVDAVRIEAYKERRLHLMAYSWILDTLHGNHRRNLINHVHRQGGEALINFTQYPEAERIYNEIKEQEKKDHA